MTALLGIAGQHAGRAAAALQTVAQLGVAGVNTNPLSRTIQSALTSPKRLPTGGQTMGDRIAQSSLSRAIIFNTFSYDIVPVRPGSSDIRLRVNREWVLPGQRRFRVGHDSDAMGRYSGNAPMWATLDRYIAGLELVQPDLYMTFDVIGDLVATQRNYEALRATFPNDALPGGRMWAVWPATATWNPNARVDRSALPASLRGSALGAYIPINTTQRPVPPATLEAVASAVVANAQELARTPAFRTLVERHGKIALGGMAINDRNSNPIPRVARHLYGAVLCEAFPDAQFWLLGQANFPVVNGLGCLGLLDRVWVDGLWYLKEAMCLKLAYLQDGLITMWNLTTQGQGTDVFWPRDWLVAGNLYALLGAYLGTWQWPSVPLPLDLRDSDAVAAVQGELWAAAQALNIAE